MNPASIPATNQQALAARLAAQPELDFAVLVGSRATSTAHGPCDWG